MLVIRKAVKEDALGIAIVNVYTWKTTYAGLISDSVIDVRIKSLPTKAEKIKDDIDQGKNVIVAAIDNTIIGFCTYGESRNKAFNDSGEIYALYVLDGYHGKNIGKALFLVGIEGLVSEGKTSMIINCLQNNPAVEFYKHMGGKIAGVRKDTVMDSIISENILHYPDLSVIRDG